MSVVEPILRGRKPRIEFSTFGGALYVRGEYGNSGGYEWTSAIDNGGQALVGSVENNEASGPTGGAPLWLHGWARGCGGFQTRTALTNGPTQASMSIEKPESELTAFAGPRDVFHLVWGGARRRGDDLRDQAELCRHELHCLSAGLLVRSGRG